MKNAIKTWSIRSLWLCCIVALVSCSSIPGFRPNTPKGDAAGAKDEASKKLYLTVSPEEALDALTEIAPEHGWEVKSVGEQYDLTGARGKYFRIETQKLIGGRLETSGIFFSDPKGTYVLIGEREMGLPADLIDPLKALLQQ